MASRFPRVRSYELMVIFHPEVEEEALGALVEQVRTYITDVEGSVTVLNRETPWGRRRLAYPIRHEGRDLRDGIYALYYFDVEAGRAVDIEREIKLNTRIIRYMLIQQSTPTMEPPVPAEPAPAPDGAGPSTAAPPAGSETSPGTPPEATPTPVEPTVPATAGAPLPSEENVTSPTLDSSPEPSLPSTTLPPADVSLVEVASAAEPAEATPPVGDPSTAEAPPEVADLAESSGAGNGPAAEDEAATLPTT